MSQNKHTHTHTHTHTILTIPALIHPLYLLAIPYTVLLPDAPQRRAAVLACMSLKAVVSLVSFPALTVLITNSAASASVLGTVNGLAVAVAGLGRAVGPLCAGAIFSWGVARDLVLAPWLFLAAVAVLGGVPVWLVDEPAGFSQKEAEAEAEAEEASTDGDSEEEQLLGRQQRNTTTYGAT